MIIDYVNESGGVLGKYKIVQVDGDSQSKAEVAINEAERLLNVEKVDILAGVYSERPRRAARREGGQAEAVPLDHHRHRRPRCFDGRNLQYTFRPQPNGGLSSASCRCSTSQRLRPGQAQEGAQGRCALAIIYEDGPYGADVAPATSPRPRSWA